MNIFSSKIIGSIIGLKPEYEERYKALHRNTFPQVLQRINNSNIIDYSIFLHNGILFSHMVYNGVNFNADMQAIGADAVTRDWWKLTDPMQQPFAFRKENEWWAEIALLFDWRSEGNSPPSKRKAFTMPLSAKIKADIVLKWREVLSQQVDIKTLRLFIGDKNFYVYAETASQNVLEDFLHTITETLDSKNTFAEMEEVFHTDNLEAKPAKKVFVTGCFDMLHSGHIAFLQEAAELGHLYVCIGSDANVHHLKGRYPVTNEKERKYMLNALACVHECRVNKGWGIIDFEQELREISPDYFMVNEDGHTPAKQALCKELGIEYRIMKRIPHENLPVRSTTALRTECTIPFRIDLAGGWLDQPFVSKYYPGAVLTISIEPTLEFNERSGMSSSTRRKAIELWKTEIPQGDPEQLAKMLFSFENPPGTKIIAGSQDSLGIVFPGLNRFEYNNNYWPEKSVSIDNEKILSWLEQHLYLVTLGPRANTFNVLANTKIDEAGAKALSIAADNCWNALLKKDVKAFGEAFKASFKAQIAMFPHMVDDDIMNLISQYENKVFGYKLSGAGGGGYLIMVSDKAIDGAMQIKIRRKNTLL